MKALPSFCEPTSWEPLFKRVTVFHIMRPHIPVAPPGARSSLGSIFKHRRTNFTLIPDGLRWPRSSEHNSKSRDKTTSPSTAKGAAGRHQSALIGQLRQLFIYFFFLKFWYKISAQTYFDFNQVEYAENAVWEKKNNEEKQNPLLRRKEREPWLFRAESLIKNLWVMQRAELKCNGNRGCQERTKAGKQINASGTRSSAAA